MKDVQNGKGTTLQVCGSYMHLGADSIGGGSRREERGDGGKGEGTGAEVHGKNRDKCNVKHDTRRGVVTKNLARFAPGIVKKMRPKSQA